MSLKRGQKSFPTLKEQHYRSFGAELTWRLPRGPVRTGLAGAACGGSVRGQKDPDSPWGLQEVFSSSRKGKNQQCIMAVIPQVRRGPSLGQG